MNELAVALTYALFHGDDVVATASRRSSAATRRSSRLTDDELAVLFDLVVARLATSIAISAHRSGSHPDNEYLLVSQAPALRLLRRLMSMRPDFLHFVARHAAGLQPVPRHDAIVAWLGSATCRPAAVLPIDLERAPRVLVSLADGAPGTEHAADPVAYEAWLTDQLAATTRDRSAGHRRRNLRRGSVVLRRRAVRDRRARAPIGAPGHRPVRRRRHDGARDVARTCAQTVVDNDAPFDYGPTVIVEHEAGDAGPFWCLYGHLARRTLDEIRPGQPVAAGQVVGWIGDHTVNGGWAPHVHVQLITDLMDGPDATGPWHRRPVGTATSRARASRAGWRCGGRSHRTPTCCCGCRPRRSTPARRREPLRRAPPASISGQSLSISYDRPLSIVRGRGARLIDHSGRAYLDCVNNVCHVGHAHPHVVAALTRQAAVLNTNTRYLHPTILDYAERLAAMFPAPLEVVYLVNSGSEANELALRMARTVTGRHDVVAVDWGYHGNTNDLIEISAYKFNRAGGSGRPDHVHLADLPDVYRGQHRGPDAAARYAQSVARAADDAQRHDGAGCRGIHRRVDLGLRRSGRVPRRIPAGRLRPRSCGRRAVHRRRGAGRASAASGRRCGRSNCRESCPTS